MRLWVSSYSAVPVRGQLYSHNTALYRCRTAFLWQSSSVMSQDNSTLQNSSILYRAALLLQDRSNLLIAMYAATLAERLLLQANSTVIGLLSILLEDTSSTVTWRPDVSFTFLVFKDSSSLTGLLYSDRPALLLQESPIVREQLFCYRTVLTLQETCCYRETLRTAKHPHDRSIVHTGELYW